MKKNISRRDFLHLMAMAGGASLVSCVAKVETPAPTPLSTATQRPEPTTASPTDIPQPTSTSEAQTIATVYMTTAISAAGLLKVYQTLGRVAKGKVAMEISSGEPGGHYFLSPDLIAPLVKEVNGTIVECNTAYGGAAQTRLRINASCKSMASRPSLRWTSWTQREP